jgi:hypothetical protein
MVTNFKGLIEQEGDRLFREMEVTQVDPITGTLNFGSDPIAPQKRHAVLALLASEWFAVNGPPDAPPLPLNLADRDRYRDARGLKGVVGFYARSLARQDYDFRKHPSFEDFARGLMALAVEKGLWNLEKDETLIRRFPPLPLPGMTPSAYWAPPEEYEETMASYYRHLRSAA